MRSDERAAMIQALGQHREAIAALRRALDNGAEVMRQLQRGSRPPGQQLLGHAQGLRAGSAALERLVGMIDEFERLVVLAPTDSPLDDNANGDSEGEGPEGSFRSIEMALAGAHSLLGDVSNLLAGLAAGQQLTRGQYREKQQLVLASAANFDNLRQTLRTFGGRQG